MTIHMLIGDPHQRPGISTDRFEWAGKFALKHRPDVIVTMGDWADMESLCSYDKGKKSFEGRRYAKDIETANEALDRFAAPISEYNAMRTRNGKKQYRPRKVALLGNHDGGRINRAIELSSELEGTISTDDIKFKEHGWEVHEYLRPTEIDGIMYCHYFISGVMGNPIGISGEYPANQTLKKKHMSCTGAHNHIRDFAERTQVNGKKILGLYAGCYLAGDQYEDYAGEANHMWWRGLILCKNVKDGYYDPDFHNIRELRREFG